MNTALAINLPRLLQRIQALADVGAIDGGGVCRLALTDADRDGRDLVVGWMRELGLEISIDAIGNVVGLRRGLEEGAPVMTGSHIDTVRTGGRYDGNLGVLAGLEVVATLNDAGMVTRRPLAVAFFTNEEGARFQPDMMGSLVYQGDMALQDALDTVGIDGTTVRENLERIGYAGGAPVGDNKVHAFVELHVEQGPLLEHEGVTIGAVTGVQGIHWTEYTVEGISNHAGTTPMALRHDAGIVAARITCFVRDLTLELGGGQLATVGQVQLTPNLINVIANRAVFTIDLRNTDGAVLAEAVRRTFAFAEQAAQDEGVRLMHRSLADFAPVMFDERMIARVEQIATGHGLSVRRMPSGAGHDAQMLARICPTGMIFVPSVGGLSHNIDEFTNDQDIGAGADVLLEMLLELAST
ncbi:M20 family metallo-hydrolase [Pseudomonas saxonica]|uniref:M20 family metallo-hydrolase n=1 Tax=Pseudomonas saxonica TaxID=2600598 RepID=UPI002D77C8FF|nr:M20 family metallo-hydrolase [Pseudomonas saxonica]WRQ73537.1 M20 family metallo-hydrolase [Pseudomonas saxonica]